MDVISHGLWGGLLLGRRGNFWLAALFGMLPDGLAFIPYLVRQLLTGQASTLFSRATVYPPWVLTLYNCSHSLVLAGFVFYFLCRIRLDLGLSFLAWPLHILFDIPTHAAASFPTKFLFPLSHLYFDGIPWHRAPIFLANWLLLGVFWLLLVKPRTARIR